VLHPEGYCEANTLISFLFSISNPAAGCLMGMERMPSGHL